jgi:hypothetical protein
MDLIKFKILILRNINNLFMKLSNLFDNFFEYKS